MSQGQISIPAYSYPAGFLPAMEHGSLRPATAYPFMIPGPYVAATPYQHQVKILCTVLNMQTNTMEPLYEDTPVIMTYCIA